MSKRVHSDNYLDKMQVASVRLADTIYGFFSGNHPATTIDNARAVSEVLSGVKRYLHKNKTINDTELEFEDKGDGFMDAFRRTSNFTKHADRDTDHTALMTEKASYVALRTTVMDYRSLLGELVSKQMIVPDEEDGAWHFTEEYGNGNSTLILCNLYDAWDVDGFGLDISMRQHEEEGFTDLLDRTIGRMNRSQAVQEEDYKLLAAKMGEALLQVRERRVSNSDLSVKRRWRDIADELMLWPVPHSGGLKLARDKGVDFKLLEL